MNTRFWAYLLIGLGALDYVIWLLNGLSFGWLEFIVGVNFISQIGAAIMITIGIALIKNEKSKSMSEVDLINDLEKEEEIVFKHSASGVTIAITNKKIIIWQAQFNTSYADAFENVVTDEKLIFFYSDIDSVKAVKTSEIHKFIKFIPSEFGISFKMKDGSIKNIRTSKSELISAYITKQLKLNE